MKVIIFGANGQDGFYLSLLLEKQCYTVIGVSRSGNNNTTDITKYEEVAQLIKNTNPVYIFSFSR